MLDAEDAMSLVTIRALTTQVLEEDSIFKERTYFIPNAKWEVKLQMSLWIVVALQKKSLLPKV